MYGGVTPAINQEASIHVRQVISLGTREMGRCGGGLCVCVCVCIRGDETPQERRRANTDSPSRRGEPAVTIYGHGLCFRLRLADRLQGHLEGGVMMS